jgi:hypothetical protein
MIDDELIAAVRRASEAIPPNAPDLRSVHRRHRRRRSRHAVTAGAAVLALLTGTGVVLAKLTPSVDPTPAATSPVTATATAPAADATTVSVHRHGDSVFENKTGTKLGFQLSPGLTTLRGGQITTITKPAEVDDIRQWVPVPGGGYALLGSKDLAPGTPRADGTGVTNLDLRLVTLSADGHVTLSRNVRIPGQDVQLAGVDNGVAYLARGSGGLVKHDLATGAETRLTVLDAVTSDPERTYSVQHGILLVASPTACAITAWDLKDGHSLWSPAAQPGFECEFGHADEAAVSPDAHWLAYPMVQYDPQGNGVTSLGIVDLTRRTMRTQVISTVPPADGLTFGAGILGLAWSTGNIRVAWPNLPRPTTRVYDLADVLKFTDVQPG